MAASQYDYRSSLGYAPVNQDSAVDDRHPDALPTLASVSQASNSALKPPSPVPLPYPRIPYEPQLPITQQPQYLPFPGQSYSAPPQFFSAPSVPLHQPPPPIQPSYSVSSAPQQPYTSSQQPISYFSNPTQPIYQPSLSNDKQRLPSSQPYPSLSYEPSSSAQPVYQSALLEDNQSLPYPQSYPSRQHDYQLYPARQYDSNSSAQGVFSPPTAPEVPSSPSESHHSANAPPFEGSHPQTTPQATSYQNTESQDNKMLQPASLRDALARVSVQDGGEPQYFASASTLGSYLKIFPEADNDQGCRVLKYGPNCPSDLLMQLFEHFDFPRFSMFPYGFAGDFSIADHWGVGSCKCQNCMEGQLCGHYVLQKNFRFYVYQDVGPSSSTSPQIISTRDVTTISAGGRKYDFRIADWNMQFFRFRSRRLQTTIFAFDALIYQNYESEIKLRSSPLGYVFSQLDAILGNWDSILKASAQFLSSFRVEILEERLETDRSIIRNLLVAAQHWEEFRKVLQTQLQRLEFLENVHGDPRWTEGHDNHFQLLAVASGYLQKFRAIDYRIMTELMQETDSLVQRISNLITIDEGYRSRDQNESIRRLTWITVSQYENFVMFVESDIKAAKFIFLPLIFTAGIFSMQVDLFTKPPAWHYYVYVSLALMIIVFSGYALLRARRRTIRLLRWMVSRPLRMLANFLNLYINHWSKNSRAEIVVDPEKQLTSSKDEIPTVLKWAASSGRTDVVRQILQVSTNKAKLTPGVSGQALLLAIQSGHPEAAILLINNGEGLSYTDERNATALHWAARMGQFSICQQLLEKGILLGAKDQDEQTALDWAMKGDSEITINLLLKGGKNFTRQETANLQSLHFSARMGDIAMIKEFHKQGSSLEARDGKGQTVLFHAVKGKHHGIVQWLIEEGHANVQAVDKEGLSALHVAASVCDMKSADILIEHGANVNAHSSRNLTPLHCIPHSEGIHSLIFLHGKGADINAFDKDNNRVIHKAASSGDAAALFFKVASDLGADLNVQGLQSNTPVHIAAESGSKAILEILVEENVDFEETRNAEGYTPLMMASRAGKIDAMRYLLEKGSNYDVVDSNGQSLIELTIGWGSSEVMSILQEYGADYSDVTSASGDAHPVWRAVRKGQSASVAKILDGGLSIEYKHQGVRILQHAIEANNEEVARLLIERGAAVDATDMRGWTALHSAAYSGNIDLMLLVLQKTENHAPTDQQGWTPLDLAAFYKHDDIQNLLDPEGKIKAFAWMKNSHKKARTTNFYCPPIVNSVVAGVAEAPGY